MCVSPQHTSDPSLTWRTRGPGVGCGDRAGSTLGTFLALSESGPPGVIHPHVPRDVALRGLELPLKMGP